MITRQLKDALTNLALDGATEGILSKDDSKLEMMCKFMDEQDQGDPVLATDELVAKANELGLEDHELLICVMAGIHAISQEEE